MSSMMPEIHSNIPDEFSQFHRIDEGGLVSYAAGFPGYPEDFMRDKVAAGVIASHADILYSAIETGCQYQGTRNNHLTGEQDGRIHHQMPGAQLVGREGYTTYNACDSTPLFLIAGEALTRLRKESFSEKPRDHFLAAAKYIVSKCTSDNLFYESPPPDSPRFSLRVTYWKDSILPHIDGKEEPEYPVMYAHAHFIAARGLLSAAKILDEKRFAKAADTMFEAGITTFINDAAFTIYKDTAGALQQPSSDELHALAYIPKRYHSLLPLEAIQERSRVLETNHGYLCTPPEVAEHLSDRYHGDVVWVYEQAFIHYGATKFGLNHQAAVAARIAPHIAKGQELFGRNLEPLGNPRQLWSVAAAQYFADRSSLRTLQWL